jgi:hypothetical protein
VLENLRAKYSLVVFLCIVLNTFENVREFREDLAHQEFLGKRERFNVGVSNV